MKIKKYWVALQIRKNEKYDAFILPVTECDNIYSKLTNIVGLVSANIYDTEKAATQVVRAWVDGFRKAGVYEWDTMSDGTPAPF